MRKQKIYAPRSIEIRPLKEANWEYYHRGNWIDGYWKDPINGQYHKTKRALEILVKRTQKG